MGCGSSKSSEIADPKSKKDQPKPANSNPAGEGKGISKKEEPQPKTEEKVENKPPEEKKIQEVHEDNEDGDPPTLDMRKGNSPKKGKIIA